MAFKTKTKNRHTLDDRQTLDAKHNNILQSFTDNKDNIEDLYKALDNIKLIINNLNIENKKSPILNILLQKQLWDYDDKKKILEDMIFRIENNVDEKEYMLKTGKLLSNYYKIVNDEIGIRIPISNSQNDTNNKKKHQTRKTLFDYEEQDLDNSSGKDLITTREQELDTGFSKSRAQREELDTGFSKSRAQREELDTGFPKSSTQEDLDKTLIIHSQQDLEQKMELEETFVPSESYLIQTKDTIFEKYMKLIDKNYINITNDNIDNYDTCPKCMIEMLLNNNTGQLICPKCGIMENIIVDSDKPSFKEPPKEMTSFCYKRINHLNEFLAQFQAKETTDIPEDVYNEILMEIRKERITNMALITPDKMRILLKKIKKNDYYEHIPYIINQLNGLPAPVIAPEIEEIIRGMFKAIQIPFEVYCPNKRKNFLSYNYVMYKFFELLELDEYLDCFQLLKSRTKLHQQDEIWKNICKDLNWEFIKSL